jgi:deoxyribodipyrimidine photo-lyase
MKEPGRTAIWWIRRDLRLADNQALQAALECSERVIPVFILDPTLLNRNRKAVRRLAFLMDGLRDLDGELRERGSRLILRHGSPSGVLPGLAAEVNAAQVFAEEDYSPYARSRDAEVAQRVELILTGGLTIHPPGRVVKQDGSPYTVFTAYLRAWEALPGAWAPGKSAPVALHPLPPDVPSLPLPEVDSLPGFPAGEREAASRLRKFAGRAHSPIHAYDVGRDRLDIDGTSSLSPYLRFGMLSARQAIAAARRALLTSRKGSRRRGPEIWIRELIWREFYLHILRCFPDVLRFAFRPGLRSISWRNSEEEFRAWCDGRTGYPVVDACMRQLQATGWLHNRGRMIVASFLCKDLLIDWRWGEHWFMQHLIDGDPAANNGGWQWTAGVGTDAAPYFRVFNPVLQGKKSDPRGTFVRRWVPELSAVPGPYIHEPWRMPYEVQRAIRCEVGKDYPGPIVEHDVARRRALQAYRASQRPRGAKA